MVLPFFGCGGFVSLSMLGRRSLSVLAAPRLRWFRLSWFVHFGVRRWSGPKNRGREIEGRRSRGSKSRARVSRGRDSRRKKAERGKSRLRIKGRKRKGGKAGGGGGSRGEKSGAGQKAVRGNAFCLGNKLQPCRKLLTRRGSYLLGVREYKFDLRIYPK